MERYKKNIALEEISNEGQQILSQSKVLICGSGGLGSGVIANLAGFGIGTIGIVDFDKVEKSNLNRQFIHTENSIGISKVLSAKKWLNEYNSKIKVEIFNIKLDDTNYQKITQNYDFIVDCFDDIKSKFILNDIALKTGKILIHANVSGFAGEIMTIVPHKTACLRCIFNTDDIETSHTQGITSGVVSSISSLQSTEILKLILSIGITLDGKMLTYNALSNSFKIFKLEKNPDCKFCKIN